MWRIIVLFKKGCTLLTRVQFIWSPTSQGYISFFISVNFNVLPVFLLLYSESAERTASIVRSMNSDALAYYCDCRSEDEVAHMAMKVASEIGPVDILVNNAGILHGKSFLELSTDDIRKTFDVNVLAHFWV